MRNIIPILATLTLLFVQCTRHYYIEERARQQVFCSIPDELESYCPGSHDWRIENLATLYVNDTICILQFTARFRDSQDEKRVRDYKYFYMVDMMMSRIEGKALYSEEFRNELYMPEEVAKQLRKDIKDNRENVYNQCFGRAIRVRKPFDSQ